MDGHQFDQVLRTLVTSRRSVSGLVLAVGSALAGSNVIHAKKKKKKCPVCKKRKKGKCKANQPDGSACSGGTCRAGVCVPSGPPDPPCACTGGTCRADGECICSQGMKCASTLCCAVGQRCNGGACDACPSPPDLDICATGTFGCGTTTTGLPCGCVTTAAGSAGCANFIGGNAQCFACTTNAQCDTTLGVPPGRAVCVADVDCFCSGGVQTMCALNCLTS